MSGKWHIGGKYGVCPWNRGFDRSLTGIAPAFYYPEAQKAKSLHLNGEPVSPTSDQLPKDWYSTNLYAEMGNRFLTLYASPKTLVIYPTVRKGSVL